MLAANDDRLQFVDKSSFISFIAPSTGTYFVKSFHSTGFGIYGSYDISVTGLSTQSGSSGKFTPTPGFTIERHPTDVNGNVIHPIEQTFSDQEPPE